MFGVHTTLGINSKGNCILFITFSNCRLFECVSLKFASSVQSQVDSFLVCVDTMSIAFVYEKAMVFCLLLLQLIPHLGNFKNYPLLDLKSVASPTQLEYVTVNKLDMTFFKWTTLITCANVLCMYLMIHFRVVECCSSGFERW